MWRLLASDLKTASTDLIFKTFMGKFPEDIISFLNPNSYFELFEKCGIDICVHSNLDYTVFHLSKKQRYLLLGMYPADFEWFSLLRLFSHVPLYEKSDLYLRENDPHMDTFLYIVESCEAGYFYSGCCHPYEDRIQRFALGLDEAMEKNKKVYQKISCHTIKKRIE